MKPGVPLSREDFESLYLLTTELAGQLERISDFETRQAQVLARGHSILSLMKLGFRMCQDYKWYILPILRMLKGL